MKTYILYHKSCQDGFGAAWAAWKKFGSDAEYIPVQYGEPLPALTDGSDVFIVDFAYSRDILLKLKERMNSLVVLDHHKTAKAALEGLDFAIFDMDRSGALITWQYFHPNTPVPFLIKHISDRDLWKFKYPDTKAVSMALFSYSNDFEVWDKLAAQEKDLIKEGKILLRQQDSLVKIMLKKMEWITIDEFKVPAIYSPILAAEACDELEKKFPEAPFCVFYSKSDGKMFISMRCNRGSTDVSQIALRFGGGGHKAAAAFAVPDSSHLSLVSKKTLKQRLVKLFRVA